MTMARRAEQYVHGPRSQNGLAVVEFVVTAPLVLLLLLGSAEVGRAFVHYATLTYSVRDAVRFATEKVLNGSTKVVLLTNAKITETKNLAVYGNVGGTGNARLPNYQIGQVAVDDAGNSNIRVTATYPYQPMIGPILPGFGSGSVALNFNMQVAVTMRAIS
jgi:Flp pilus assembly protein TadG